MRLDVLLGTQTDYEAAIPAPGAGKDVAAYYQDQLAHSAGDAVEFQSIPPQDKPSQAFALINVIEGAIMEYLREHESPAQVRIICTDEEIARLYKVVYNFSFATTKADRMDDDHWD